MMQFLLLEIKVTCKKKKKKRKCRFVLYPLPFGNCSLYSVLGIFSIIKPFIPHVFFCHSLWSMASWWSHLWLAFHLPCLCLSTLSGLCCAADELFLFYKIIWYWMTCWNTRCWQSGGFRKELLEELLWRGTWPSVVGVWFHSFKKARTESPRLPVVDHCRAKLTGLLKRTHRRGSYTTDLSFQPQPCLARWCEGCSSLPFWWSVPPALVRITTFDERRFVDER